MMTKIPEVLKSGSGKRWVWITGVVAIFALLFAIAWNIECERAVAPQELPGEARSFIAQHSAVVPAQIADYVARNFPGTFLVGIEHTCREWEVKLNNTIELTFDDKRFALKEYDD